ncbi:unnamed protein product [Phytophthora fragariaefolia]|uniref:Unnamed protein product n=1 Tax=Phytophthora fragariaefolia TaxID=1490495 RepID=A0A9W6XVX6_9STRA|nr:unnamed protein product [Phytophthora fragariaefolia]
MGRESHIWIKLRFGLVDSHWAWEPTATATQRNQCLHIDYLSLGASYGDSAYVLVFKDELTHYCELAATDPPTISVAAEAVLDWFKRFGLPEEWVSDNGSHFKAQVMEELAGRLHATQKVVPVYTPWINGTVERANLNHAAVESLGGHAPVGLFAGLPAASPLDCVVVPARRTPRVLSLDLERLSEQLDNLRGLFREMHGKVVERKERKRLANMARSKGSMCNFEPGDYVLWSRVDKRLQSSKLLVRWVGPFRVTEALAHSFMVEHLLIRDVYEVHGSLLKHYCYADLDVTQELREHIANQGIVLGVRAITEHRVDRGSRAVAEIMASAGTMCCQGSMHRRGVCLLVRASLTPARWQCRHECGDVEATERRIHSGERSTGKQDASDGEKQEDRSEAGVRGP